MDAVTRPLDQKEYSSEKIDLRVWRRLIAYAMRRKGDVVRLACVLLVVSSIDILYPQLTRYAINHFIEGNTTQGLWAFALFYAAVIAVQGFGVFFFVRGAGRLEMNICYDIRQDAFTHLQELSFSFYDTTSVGCLEPGRFVLVWLFCGGHCGGAFVDELAAGPAGAVHYAGAGRAVCVLSAAHFAPAAPGARGQQPHHRRLQRGHYGRGNHQDAGARRGKLRRVLRPYGHHAPRQRARRFVERAVSSPCGKPWQHLYGAGPCAGRQPGVCRRAGFWHPGRLSQLHHAAVRPHSAACQHSGRNAGRAGLGRARDRPFGHKARHCGHPRGNRPLWHGLCAAQRELAAH